MDDVEETYIRTLITAESIISAILLLYLSGHINAWSQNIERYQHYSIMIFLSIILYIGCIFTLFRSMILTFQSIHSKDYTTRNYLYHVAYNLFLLVLFAVSVGIFVGFLSVVRQAIFSAPPIPIQIYTPWWVFLILFLLLCIYVFVLIIQPQWISQIIDVFKSKFVHESKQQS